MLRLIGEGTLSSLFRSEPFDGKFVDVRFTFGEAFVSPHLAVLYGGVRTWHGQSDALGDQINGLPD